MNDLEKIQKLLLEIPKGQVTTYKIISLEMGKLNSYRCIGSLLRSNPKPNKYPCYKVVKSNGEIGGYSLGVEEKIKRLTQDGIKIRDKKILNFKHILYEY